MTPPQSRPDRRGRPEEHGHGRPAMTELERRYARWMALFYPADDRRKRGSELVDKARTERTVRGRPGLFGRDSAA
jgi:hypothetical protein